MLKSLTLAALFAATAAQAQMGTGSLAGWTVVGDVVSSGGSIRLTNAYYDDPLDRPLNLSGHSAVGIEEVETASGVAAYALDWPGEAGYEGSVVAQSFAALAGQTLAFTWSFSTAETRFLDHAYAVINGQVHTLTTAGGPTSGSFDLMLTASGPVSLAFGVIDTGDYSGVSTLSIDSLQVTAVPEPASLALMLAGIAGVGAAARRRQLAR